MTVTSINSDYNNDLHSWEAIEHQIKMIAKAGFTHTSWMHNWDGDYIYSPSEMLQVRDILREYGIKAHTMHGSEGGIRPTERLKKGTNHYYYMRERTPFVRKDYTSSNRYIRLAGVDLIRNRIDLSATIGSSVVVLHSQLPFDMFERSSDLKEEYYAQVCKSFDELQEYAKASGVRIALENLLWIPYKHQTEYFDRMFERYDSDFLGMCFDSGHASLMCRDNFYIYLERYGNRLIATHLQDTDSIAEEDLDNDIMVGKSDSHRPPFTGVLDWDMITSYIARSDMQLPADMEVCLPVKGCFASEKEELEVLIDCRKKGERIQQMVETHQKQNAK